jgi:hypothetical protein
MAPYTVPWGKCTILKVDMEIVNIPQRYQNDVELAVNYLKGEGCSAIYL